MEETGLEHLAGRALPEGSFTITHEEERRVLDVVGGKPSGDGTAHPLWAYIAPQRGIGIGIAELCALAEFDVDDGPMLGSSSLTYHAPIRVDVPYRVTGEVLGVARKRGRIGTFDVMEFRENLHDPDGVLVATSTSTYILPRKDA